MYTYTCIYTITNRNIKGPPGCICDIPPSSITTGVYY